MIKFVICGIEHSGTTLVSDLFRQIEHVDAGFEVGVLLCNSPRQFLQTAPYATNILDGWKISKSDLERCCDTDSFSEFYTRLHSASKGLRPDAQTIFDKTPRYLAQLKNVLQKVDVPFVVMYKDPRAIVFSDFTRSKQKDFSAWFADYMGPKTQYMKTLYLQQQEALNSKHRVLSISLEEICMEPRASCEKLFRHCGYVFQLEYLLLKNLRYKHNRSDTISSRMPFEYLEYFSKKELSQIDKQFAEFDLWFYR